ncbi:MAG: hypothetical protein CMM58_04235 [Rhodospirillaceae bacterium]|nr:hypothetical protein [Rhodospirillaceae bacterium]|tara:strand:+ start:1073 stop:1963 length:891 start_codon:yes stop_codon:yes gene_type:complete
MNSVRQSHEGDEISLSHITYVVTDLKTARETLKKLGFKIIFGNYNPAHDVINSIRLGLGSSFIEITNAPDFPKKSSQGIGIQALGFGTNNIEATQGRLTLNGFHPLPLISKNFRMKKPKGEIMESKSRLCWLKEKDMPEVHAEFIQFPPVQPKKAPSLSPITLHDNHIVSFNDVILCVSNPEEVVARYCWFTDQGSPQFLLDRYWKITLYHGSLIICSTSQIDQLHGARNTAKQPTIPGYSLISSNLKKTKEYFEEVGLKPLKNTKDLLLINLPPAIGGKVFIAEDELAFPWNCNG